MVYRIYVEKKKGLDNEAQTLKNEISGFLGIKSVESLRVLNRYDVENLPKEAFERAKKIVFSEPQLDDIYEELPKKSGEVCFAVEYLPGQFDQRADSAAQCVQLLTKLDRPEVRSAKVYLIGGKLSEEELGRIKKHVINPVEAREARLEKPETLKTAFPQPETVETLGFFPSLDRAGLEKFVSDYALAMDADDAQFCRDYFESEGRAPTITEIRLIDTYWSDHCRHTTFLTTIDKVIFSDKLLEKFYNDYLETRRALGRTKPQNLMDVGTIAAKYLKATGKLDRLDVSDEINACTVKIEVEKDGKSEPWLLLFKNETHNHPTEIEPFGGAATCIGGAIRDPLSGRSYVYGAMRVTGAADPTAPVEETIKGKLPQRKIVQTAAAGYSSYGNQIGLATGVVKEFYHPGYAAKRMEVGAVIAAAPQKNVRRERPVEGDVIVLLGGRTGRDGIGGATGSSKAHDAHSVETCGAEVQKGNAPEERKLQRLFRSEKVCRMIKKCNDFGAGGVSVAIGELADGLDIDLDAVPKKYEGLDGTEIAISESQERMAVVVAKEDADAFLASAHEENLEATVVARVTAEPRLKMRWKGKTIVDLSRAFLDSNGAEKHITIRASRGEGYKVPAVSDFQTGYESLLSDLNFCSGRGLAERFDSTIGAGGVLMPFGGRSQRTPVSCMVQKISLEEGRTDDCSFMSYGFDPYLMSADPCTGAYLSVVESLCRLVAAGASFEDVYLSFQEYFEKPLRDPDRWGKPFSALLGAFRAQMDYGVAAIGGKDSMSGSFEKLDVPPTLISFAVTTGKTSEVLSPEFKKAGRKVVLIAPEYDENGLPLPESEKACFARLTELARKGKIVSAYALGRGGIAHAVYEMCIGNRLGFAYDPSLPLHDLFSCRTGSFLAETTGDTGFAVIGETTEKEEISFGSQALALSRLDRLYEGKLEGVYPTLETDAAKKLEAFSFDAKSRPCPAVKHAKPRVLVPVFPGTNCEYDTARALNDAGAEAKLFIVRNLTRSDIENSAEAFAKELEKSQMLFIPGGFSGGDEPDGSGKFILSFLRGEEIKEKVHELLDRRDGLICGICNGFQALIKLGLVPCGHIVDTNEHSPTLTFNRIARHQSKLVRIRVSSNKSPWLAGTKPGEIFTVPISHGEGRFLADEQVVRALAENGQIATQYVDLAGDPTDDIRFNPNGSIFAIEGITSPDGRVFGKMGHSERVGRDLYKNVPGETDMKMFVSAVRYFK